MFAHGHTPFSYQFAYSLEDLKMLTECQAAFIRVGRRIVRCFIRIKAAITIYAYASQSRVSGRSISQDAGG